jgi:hypothetical protein
MPEHKNGAHRCVRSLRNHLALSHIEIFAQYDRLLVLHALTPALMLIRILAQANGPSRAK